MELHMCTCFTSYFILDKALLLFIKLYINLDYICFLPKISMYSHLHHPLKKPSYLLSERLTFNAKNNNNT